MGPQQLLRSLGSLVARIRDEIETPTATPAPVPSVPGYTIIRSIGKGGMGKVYLARDETLGRKVAIKFVSGFVPGDHLARRQFLSEAKAMAAVSHANIVHVYAFGESDGLPYIVMEYVEGQSLGRLLRDSGRLSEAQALDIVDQTANALEAAWEQGIVHGDVKPSNILIDSKGTVHVCDFGLARPNRAELPTAPGKSSPVAGTPHYMSPEQAAGRPTDLRSDLYSLGVVLYEMLVGRAPFASVSPFEIMKQSGERLPPLEEARPVSQEVSELYRWMTRAKRAERPESHAALRRRIAAMRQPAAVAGREWTSDSRERVRRKRMAVAAAAVLAIGIGGAAVTVDLFDRAPDFAHVIVIGDFENLTGDPALDYLGGALRHEVERRLVGLEGLIVVPPGLSSEPKFVESDTNPDLSIMGALTGSAGSLGVEYRLRDELDGVDLGDDSVRGRATKEEVLDLQERLVASVAAMLADKLGSFAFDTPQSPTPQSGEVLILYQRGVTYLRDAESTEDFQFAIDLLRRAVSIEPTFAPAHAALGRALRGLYELTGEDRLLHEARDSCAEAREKGETLPDAYLCSGWIELERSRYPEAAEDFIQAIRRGGTAEAHRGLGAVYSRFDDDVAAEAYLRRGLESDPAYPGAYLSLGYFLAKRDRYEESLEQYTLAAEYRPNSAFAFTSIGGCYFMMGRYDEAVDALSVSINLRETETAWSNLGLVHLSRGETDDAVRAFEAAVAFENASYLTYGSLARAYHWANDPRAEQYFQEAARRAEDKLDSDQRLYAEIMLAYYYVMLGERERSLDMLEQAISEVQSDSKAEVHFWAAIVHLELGERAKALESLRKAKDRGYSVYELRDAPEFAQLAGNADYQVIIQGP